MTTTTAPTHTPRLNLAEDIPSAYAALVRLDEAALKHTDARLKSLVELRVSQINGCAFCIDMHSRDLLKSGISVDKLVLVPVWHESGKVFSQRERAALAWAETVTRIAETHAPDADYETAKAEFSDKELADLTYAIALMNAFNRFGIAFRVPPAAAARA
jgi:AhpD family alkylhydroperoxidase